MRILGTTRLSGIIGRANPYIFGALLAYDAISIGLCAKKCHDEEEEKRIIDCIDNEPYA